MKKIFYLLFLLTLTGKLFAQTFGTPQTPVSGVSALASRHNQKIVNGNPAFVYLDASSRLMYVRATNAAGTAWGTPVVLETAASDFGISNLEIINGKPAVAYSITGSSIDVRFKTAIDANGDTWNSFVTVNSSILTQSDVTLCNLNNRAAIAFRYNSNGTIYYSLSNTTLNSFGSPVLVASAVSANYINIKVVNSNPAISYINSTNYDLHFVRANDATGNTWGSITTVDAFGNTGSYNSLEIVNGNPALAYISDNNTGSGNYSELRYIRASNANGSSWGSPQTLHAVGGGIIGFHASLSVINGVPAIAYQNFTNTDLMYIKASDANGSVWGSPVVVDNINTSVSGNNISLTQIGTRASIAYLNKAGISSTTGDAKYIQEFIPQRYYVKANATGSNNGTSWANAFTSLQSALAVAISGDEVWVAAGTYKPHASSRSIPFVISSDLKVYGGFAGNESTLASRNMTLINTTNQTTLSGDLNNDDSGFSNQTENSYRIVTFSNAVSTTTLDGFRILGGNNTLGNTLSGYGSGIYNNGSGSGNSSNPTIANCKITYCSAFLGGGMYNDGTSSGNASPSITNCIFISNAAGDSGAGLANYGTSGNSSPIINRCSFIGNSSAYNSGAMNNHGDLGVSSPIITNSVFIGNYAAHNGGAMTNTGTNGGTSVPNITNCSFSGNRAVNVGGVIRNNAADVVFKNCILWGNNSLFDNNLGSVIATYSIIEGGYVGTKNLDTNPLFTTQPSFASAPTTTGDLHLPANSTGVNAGTLTGAPTTDLEGNSRPFAISNVDIGAYELQTNAVCSQLATSTQVMTWNGSSNTDWSNACNWSPSGIPGAGNFVLIPTGLTKYPIVDNNVSVTQFFINEGASLTVNASKTLTLVGNSSSQSSCNGTINNNGTISITQNSTNNPIIFATNGVLNNNLGATFTIVTTSTSGLICYDNALINNFGTLNVTAGSISLYLYTAHSASELVKNYGTMNLSGNIEKNANTLRNYSCGKIYLNVGDFYNRNSDVINEGYLFAANLVNNISGNFTNNGVLKYNTSLGSIINTDNGSVIVKNTPTPIFTYGGTYNGTVNGIFTNVGATTSAGTFIAPNTFTPSGLPTGSQTLYAKITPSGGACNYVVPFTYNYAAPPTLTAGAVTNAATCGSATGSIAFTTTNVPNGTYSLTFTTTGTTSPKNVTVSANAFTLSGLTAGNYNDFSLTVSGATATTGTLSPAKIVANPASPTLTAGTATNPTTCSGSDGNTAFTSTNLPNGTYSLSFTPTGTGATTSPQNVTVSGNAFTLLGLKAGSYSNFSVTSAGCTGAVATSKVIVDPAPPTLTAGTATNTTTCGGANGSIAFTSTNLPNGIYSLSFTPTGTGTTTSPQSVTVSGNTFTLSGLKAGTYSNFSVTNTGCTGTATTSKVIADPAAPTLTSGTSTNPTTCGGANGSIPFTSTNLPNGTYSLSFTATGAGVTTSPQSITVSGNAFTLTGLKAGTYSAFSVTSAGCTGIVATSKILTDPAAPTLTVGTSTNPTTCGGANGSIAFSSTNLPDGTYSLSFTPTGAGATTSPQSITVSGNAFSLTGLKAGTYSVFSVTSAGCTGTVATSKVLTDPAAPTLTAGTSINPTTCAGANGSIPFTSTNLPNGIYSLSFTATGAGATTSPQSITVAGNAFSLTGLTAGTYSAFSVTSVGCTGTVATSKVLTDPAAPTLTAGTVTNPTTCSGTGSIAFTSTNLPNGTYSLSFTATGAGATTSPQSITVSGNIFSLTGLKAGAYSNFSVTTAAGCTGTVATTKTLTDPAAPTLTAGTATNPTTCGGTGSIAFTATNLPNGTYSLSFTATGAGATTSPQSITVSGNIFSLTGLKAGAYSNFSVTTAAGCTGTVATAKTLTDPAAPTLTAGTAVNPTTCAGANGSIPFTSTNLPNGTYSLSFTATGAGASTSPKSITISGNIFSLTGLKAGTYSAFSVTNIGCTGSDASSKILTDPATPTISAGTVANPATCGATGSIPFTATNLPNGTYSLSFTATGAGAITSPRNVVVTSNAFSLTGLSVGSYSGFSLTSTGCTATDASSKSIANPTSPTLTAGVAVNPTVCSGTDGSIPFTTNLPDATYSLSYTGTGSPKSITVSGGAFTLGTLGSGGYNNFSVTNNGCTGTANTPRSLSDPAAPVLTLGTSTNPTACNLSDGSIAFTVTNITDGTYSLTYSGAGTPQSVTIASGAFTLTGLADGTYSNFSITNGSGCTGSLATPVTLVDLALPVLTVGVATNPTTCLGTDGTIAFTSANLPDGTYSLSFTTTGTTSPQSIMVASNAFSLSGLSAGNYSNFSVTRLGCTGTVATLKTLSNPVSPTITAGTPTNPTTCLGTDGTIAFTTTNLANSTYSLSFTTTGTSSPKSVTVTNNTFTLTGLSAGNYSAFSLTNNGCVGSDATLKTLSNPATPTITAGLVTAPTSCSAADGSIAFTSTNLPNGSYTITYTGTGSPKTVIVASNAFSLMGLDDGTYSNFSITNLGCTASDATSKTVNNPAPPTLTAGTGTNPTTCASTDGTIAFTTTLPNGTYTLNYTGSGTVATGGPKSVTVASGAFTLTGLPDGTFSGFSIINAGCTSNAATTKTLTDPASPTLTAGTATNPTTCASTDGTIAFTTSLPNGTYTINYTGAGSPQTVTVTSGAFTLTGLPDGTFSGFSVTTGGCTGTSSATKTLTDPAPPTLMAGTAINPTTCASTDGSIAFTTSLPNGTYTLNYTGSGSPKSITVTSGAFTLTGLPDGTFSGFSVTTGGCTGTSSVTKTLTDPASPTLAAGTATNPTTCLSSDGTIAFTTTLPNGTYSLSYTGSGSPQNIIVVSGAFTLGNLPDGTFSGFSVTTGGCTGTSSASKTLTDPVSPTLTAGTATNPTTCLSSDGSIAFTTTLPNGTYSLSYTGLGSPQNITVVSGAFILGNLPDGTFSGFSVTTGGCTGTSSATKTLTDPTPPTLTAGLATNPTTCLSTDGSIAFTTTLLNGTYSIVYTGSGTVATGVPKSITVTSGAFTLIGLSAGNYSGFSVTTGGCTGTSSATKTLTDPAAPTLTAGIATNPSTCLSSDGSIAFTTTLPNGTYSLSYTGSGSPQNITVVSGAFTLGNLPDGTFSGFSVTTGGCTGTSSATKTLTDPVSPTLTAGTAINPSTCLGSDGTIAFTTTLPNGTYTLNYTGSGSPKSITVTGGAFTLTGLPNGTYSGFSVTTGGCTGTSSATKTLTDPAIPTLTAGTATNPSTCLGSDGTIAFTTTLPNGTYTLNYTGSGTVATGGPKSITVTSGAFTLTGLANGTYSGFSVTTGGCTGTSSATKTLTDPVSPTLTAGLATNPTTCLGTDGSIAFTSTNLPDGTYSLSFTSTGSGATASPKSITVASGVFSLTGLSEGVYSDFSVTNTGCTGTDVSIKTLIAPTPPSAVTNHVTICEGTALNLNASGGTTYQWSGPNSFTSANQNPNVSNSATVAMTGVYTVVVTNSACTASATANVIINPIPTSPTPNAIAPINLGSSATLTATGCSGTLQWYKSSDNSLVTNPVSPSTTTNYYATCEVTANGITCTSAKSADVVVTVISNQIIYVNVANTNPTQDGTTWATAFSNLQTGLTTASGISGTPVEIWVAQGTYKPTGTTDRDISFNISTGVKVYGGFIGTESDLTTRNFRTNSSILSGEIGNINSTTDNSRHVVYFDNSNNIATLDGFTITAGNADFDPRFVANLPLPSAPTSNTQTRGGGILIERGGNPLIKNCLIVNNSAVSGGGILAVDGSSPIISYCKIMGNQAAFGPGIYLQDGSNANVSNTLLSGNRGIGAFYNNVSNPTITNCTLSGNGGYNGGIFNSNSQPIIKNSIIWGNSTPFNDTQSVITYSVIQGGYTGVGNLNYDPQFVTQMPDGISPNLTGDYHLKANSLAIDRGDNGSIALTDKDLGENLRRYAGGQVDMGAFEFQGTATVSLVISVQTGNWETNTTWDIGRVPQLGDYVIINNNHTITLNGTGTAKNVESRSNSVIKFGNTSAKLNIGF